MYQIKNLLIDAISASIFILNACNKNIIFFKSIKYDQFSYEIGEIAGINDEYKEMINDEAVDKKLESLAKNVKDLQTKNGKLEAEIISVRHGVDN